MHVRSNKERTIGEDMLNGGAGSRSKFDPRTVARMIVRNGEMSLTTERTRDNEALVRSIAARTYVSRGEDPF